MARSKKPNQFKYGIEITKPHSQEMYDHNDMVSAEMKQNIHAKWSELIKPFKDEMYDDWSSISDGADIVKLQKLVCFSGYGSGYTIKDVEEEFFNELEMMQNYAIHQEYAYGAFTGLLPRTKFMMVGHGGEKFDYHVKGADKTLSPACYESIPSSKSNNQ
tara:strand:- start:119 stop:598 length:480 start_codon:yes stop_codon:yes gene_type:complete